MSGIKIVHAQDENKNAEQLIMGIVTDRWSIYSHRYKTFA